MTMSNNLWYHTIQVTKPPLTTMVAEQRKNALIRSMSNRASYELWHNRLGHPSQHIMENIHKYVDGVPRLSHNDLWKCSSCSQGKLRKTPIGKPTKPPQSFLQPKPPPQPPPPQPQTLYPGQGLHMDYGFVRGSAWKTKDADGKTITSLDGYRSYLLIVDKATRYKWIFLSRTKVPKVDEIRTFLRTIKPSTTGCYVMTDQGNELGGSTAFKDMLREENYALYLTGADSSQSNGICERPHQDLARMMRTMLHGAGFGPEYWSFAIIHAVYLMNRLPHSAIKSTPFEKLFNKKPSLRHLRIFGSRVFAYKPNKRKAKLDFNNEPARFLHFGGTDNNLVVRDERTGQIKTVRHATFDECHFTTPLDNKPPMAEALIAAGYTDEIDPTTVTPSSSELKIKLLSTDAKVPTRGSQSAAGFDVYSPISFSLEPGKIEVVPLDIAVECPKHSYVRIAPRSGLAVKHGLDTLAGVIDADYRGNVAVVLVNHGDVTLSIYQGQRIAQMIVEKIETPSISIVDTLSPTHRNRKGFGSTENLDKAKPSLPHFNISDNLPEPTIIAARAATASSMRGRNTVESHQLELSPDPYDNTLRIQLPLRSCLHPTVGLEIDMCPRRNRPILKNCLKGTPAARIARWRSTLRNAYILSVNDIPVNNLSDITELIKKAQDFGNPIDVVFGTMEKHSLHPQHGTPLVYFDQLQLIGKHLHDIKENAWWEREQSLDVLDNYFDKFSIPHTDAIRSLSPILPKNRTSTHKLTRRKLQNLPAFEWSEWQQSEYLQLDQYEKQNTFGTPIPRPPGSNCLPLLWTYLIKDDGRKKARCVCNGSPSKKGSVTLGHTYAASLDQNGSRIFWATAALRNLKVYGADVSNAFAEAPPPAAPLYVHIDTQFREWWKSKGRKDIPTNYVLPVQGALQGHPESPRLWSTLINGILVNDFNLNPTTHEPCLYSGTFDGESILFLRQTDDFAIACSKETVARNLIDAINSKMTVNIKYLGLIDRFNGVDVEQTDSFIKIHNETFINKILDFHDWQLQPCSLDSNSSPIPMFYDHKFIRSLENEQPPLTRDEAILLQRKMGFNYRQAVGELLYALVTCRPDISFPVIKLSQYSNDPSEIHYKTVREIFNYLAKTKRKGITYWKPQMDHDLPRAAVPTLNHKHIPEEELPLPAPSILQGSVDSDWAGDSRHRRSVTAYALELAGGCIYYKTKFQDTIATSSSEAEFTAACEAAKSICYVRSILDEIGVPQDSATALFIDNQGALLMADARQPTKRTRHMDIKHFKIQEWVERDIVSMRRVSTKANVSDALTKALSPDPFHRHMDRIMGVCIPSYFPIRSTPQSN